MSAPIDHMRKCTARRTSDGELCTRAAMKHQDVCPIHGGKSPQAVQAAAQPADREQIEQRVERQLERVTPTPHTPYEVLRAELARSHEATEYLGSIIQRHDDPPVAWIALWGEERNRLTKTADVMLKHEERVAARESKLTVQAVDALDDAMRGVLTDLGMDPDSTVVRELLAFHIRRAIGKPRTDAIESALADSIPPPPAPAEF